MIQSEVKQEEEVCTGDPHRKNISRCFTSDSPVSKKYIYRMV